MHYSGLRLLQLLLAGSVALLLGWLGGLSRPATIIAIVIGTAGGYLWGRRGWSRTRSRIDKRNVLIVYFTEGALMLLLVAIYAFKSFPLFAGWALVRGILYADVLMVIALSLGWAWLGYCGAYAHGALVWEREHGPIRPRMFHARSVTGQPGMIGMRGRVAHRCAPGGKVEIRGEFWNAMSIDGSEIAEGQSVVVRDIDEMDLIVERVDDPRAGRAST